jgi:choline dehydrogenase-like flavoprotein
LILDLCEFERDQNVSVDYCVIGAGIAGLALAQRLASNGRRIIVLESGPRSDDGRPHPLNVVEICGRDYAGAIAGRARALGGTSSRWGGALIPFLPGDLAARYDIGKAAWPVSFSEVAPLLGDVEAMFGVEPGPYDVTCLAQQTPLMQSAAQSEEFLLRFAKWPKFRRRNVGFLLNDFFESSTQTEIWLNATVVAFSFSEAGRLESVTARDWGGRRITVCANAFVLAAGAIESTRLLLIARRQSAGRVFAVCSALGIGFHDHVSFPAAEIQSRDTKALNAFAAFRFQCGTMRSLRFELAPEAQKLDGVASAFAHVAAESSTTSAFNALREMLRCVQSRRAIPIGKLKTLTSGAPYLLRLAWWRYMRQTLLWPTAARISLHIVVEQLPRIQNRIELGESSDEFGLPRARLFWSVGDAEAALAAAFARRFSRYWRAQGMYTLGELDWYFDPDNPNSITWDGAGDVFHPGGSTRMGTNGCSAVVDANLATFAVPNLFVVSTSVFPFGASANPTMMLIAFALRLADHLAKSLK